MDSREQRYKNIYNYNNNNNKNRGKKQKKIPPKINNNNKSIKHLVSSHYFNFVLTKAKQ